MKIGDLWVKLGLKKDEFSRGIKSSMSDLASLGKLAKGAFAAIGVAIAGAVTAVKALAKENQFLSDSVGRLGAGMRGMFESLKSSLASLDFSNILTNMREASRLARDIYDAQDAMGEIGTSYNITMAKQLQHINALKIALRDQNLSDEERIAKGRELLDIYKKLEQNPARGLGNVYSKTLDYYMQRVGINMEGRTDKQLASMRKKFVEFFEFLGTKQGESFLAAAEVVNKNGGLDSYWGRTMMANAQKAGLGDFARLAIGYSAKMNDEDRLQVEKAVTAYYEQQAKYSGETYRIQTQINSLLAGLNNDSGNGGGASASERDPKLEQATRIAQRAVESGKSQLQVLNETYETEKALLKSFGIDTTALTEEFTRNMAALFDVPLKKMQDLDNLVVDLDFELDEDPVSEFVQQFENDVKRMQELVADFTEAVTGGFVDGLQELFDQIAGVKEVNPGAIFKALLTPLADMAIREGELLVATGVGVEAIKKALGTLNGPVAIAAGAALISLGAAAKSGLAALANAGARSTSTTTYGTGGSSSGNVQTMQTELTVYVTGRISGNDILLTGKKAQNNLNR